MQKKEDKSAHGDRAAPLLRILVLVVAFDPIHQIVMRAVFIAAERHHLDLHSGKPAPRFIHFVAVVG
jgi:hypothetical protein